MRRGEGGGRTGDQEFTPSNLYETQNAIKIDTSILANARHNQAIGTNIAHQ